MFINRRLIKFWYIYTMSSIQKNKVVLYVLEWKDNPDTLSFLKSNFITECTVKSYFYYK